ncbi:MAG: FAD-dependent oxidoreductase [Hespellia sp.]|jgi:NADPH-dependent 2,4-dienoyl-CoA reductase/sulfur reductase-like enzyme/rhodanese-related sulfurtransferase|nr:FAD-dependent oxidoreductase [Hespellia sp.]
MKVLIVGGVAAGTKTAAKLKREMPDAEVTILTKDRDISYAGCGLPYYLGEVIREKEALIVNTPQKFSTLTGVEVVTETEATKVNPSDKTVDVVNVVTGEKAVYSYDKLVIATGASPIKPPIDGIDLPGVFCMRTPQDAFGAKDYIKDNGAERAVVVGGGFIGLEVAENLRKMDLRVTVIDMADQVMPGFSKDFATYIEDHLATQGIKVQTGRKMEAILGTDKVEKVQTDKRALKADLVVLSIGIRANTAFLEGSGIALCENKTVKVNEHMQTNVEDIYAVGDCVTVWNRYTNQPQWSPMGSTANMVGRVCAKNLAGKPVTYPGVLGTAVCHLPELNAGKTGFTEESAKAAGFDPISVTIVADDKAHYYPGAGNFIIKVVADKNTRKFLGVEALGSGAVDKIVDIGVTALTLHGDLDALDNMDMAYAPPFSTAIHPFVLAIQVLENKLDGTLDSVTPEEFVSGEYGEYKVIDASMSPAILGAPFVNPADVKGVLPEFGTEDKLMLVCTKGKRAYLLQNKLRYYGYKNTKVLESGTTFNGTDL